MPEFKSLTDLEKYLTQKINNALEQEVSHQARETMKDVIQTEVYDKYTSHAKEPYVRHMSDGGLIDDENIHTGLIDDGELVIRNTRNNIDDYGNAPYRDVAAIVEEGINYDWKGSEIYKMQPYPRPFHKETARELDEKGLAKKALEKGLNRQGIDTK
jgi:hypothetical protein